MIFVSVINLCESSEKTRVLSETEPQENLPTPQSFIKAAWKTLLLRLPNLRYLLFKMKANFPVQIVSK